MLEAKNTEQAELQVEMDKMTEMIGELRENCNALQRDLLSARQDDIRRQDVSVQTGTSGISGIPPVRRASLTELSSPRARLSPKRTISNISQSSLSSNSNSPRSANQLQKSIELSRPKQRSASMSSCRLTSELSCSSPELSYSSTSLSSSSSQLSSLSSWLSSCLQLKPSQRSKNCQASYSSAGCSNLTKVISISAIIMIR